MVGEGVTASPFAPSDPTSAAEPSLSKDLEVRQRALDLLEAFHTADMATAVGILSAAELPDPGIDLVLAVAEMSLDMLTTWSPEPAVDIAFKRSELQRITPQQTGA